MGVYEKTLLHMPHPWMLGRKVPPCGPKASAAVKSPTAGCLDMCRAFQDPTFTTPVASSHSAVNLAGNLLLQSVQDRFERRKLEERLCDLTERVSQAEERAQKAEEKYLDANLGVQILERQLAAARRDNLLLAKRQLQDLNSRKETDPTTKSAPFANPLRPKWLNPSSWETTPHPSISAPTITAPTPASQSLTTLPTITTTPINPSTHTTPINPPPTHTTPTIPPIITTSATPPAADTNQQQSISAINTERAVGGAVYAVVAPSNPSPTTTTTTTNADSASSCLITSMSDLKPFNPASGDVILGQGVYGMVQLFRHQDTNRPIAVKRLQLPEDDEAMAAKVTQIQHEAGLLEQFGKAEWFPTFLGCLQISQNSIGLAMEFIGDVSTGETHTLNRAIKDGTPTLSRRQWLLIAIDINQGLRFVHEKNHLMNDLKEDNCMLQLSSTGDWQARLVDLGLLCLQSSPITYTFTDDEKDQYRQRQIYGHLAPECVLRDEPTTTASDVYQLGRLLGLMGVAGGIIDLLDIGALCCQENSRYRPAVDEVLDELERIM